MKVYVLGDGAVGRIWAWQLARGGAEVIRVARPDAAEAGAPGETSGAAAARVLRVTGVAQDSVEVPRVAWEALPERFPEGAVLVLSVKAFALEELLRALRPRLGGGELLVLTQNGLGMGELLERALPGAAWARAVCYFGAAARGTDEVELRGLGRVVGAVPPGRGWDSRWAELVQKVGPTFWHPAEQKVGPTEVEWRKALLNLSINALCAVHGVRNGAVLEDAALRAQVEGLLAEALAVARAVGIRWDEAHEARQVWEAIQRVAANENSTLQDLRAGRPTEIPWLNGALITLADRFGISAPLNRALVAELEEHRRARQKTIANPGARC